MGGREGGKGKENGERWGMGKRGREGKGRVNQMRRQEEINSHRLLQHTATHCNTLQHSAT